MPTAFLNLTDLIYIFFKLNILFYSTRLIRGNSFALWDNVALDCWLLCGCLDLEGAVLTWLCFLTWNEPWRLTSHVVCVPPISYVVLYLLSTGSLIFLSTHIICLTFILEFHIITEPENCSNWLWNNVYYVWKFPVGRFNTCLCNPVTANALDSLSHPK